MVIEEIIFNLFAFSLFIVIVFKFIKKNDKIYICSLIFQFLGISINFMQLITIYKLNLFLKIVTYVFSIILPIILILLEYNGINLSEKYKINKLKILILLNKHEEARKYALEIVNKYPKSYIAHKLLGELYEKEGKINIALDEYIRAVELNEKDYEIHYKVAFLLQETNKNEEAIIMLQDLLKMKPDYFEASQLLGNILYDQERFKEAISVYMDSLKYNPTKYELYYNIGMAFTRINDFQKAKEFYQKAAKLNTYLYNGQYNLALIAMIQGELEEAEKCFLRTLQNEELEPIAYFFLAQISLIKGENDKALNYINIALELDKDIEKRIVKQPLFLPIKDKIRIPNETRKIKMKLSNRERETNKYLEEMFNLVDSLNGGGSASEIKENIEVKEIELENQLDNEKEK